MKKPVKKRTNLYKFIPKGDLRTISKDINLLKPNPKNPRHNEPAVPEVIASVKACGFRDPIEVDEKNMIVAGHTRYKAAIQLGMKYVPVIMSTYDSIKQKFKYVVLNNKTNEYGIWDNEQIVMLKDEFGFKPEELGFTEKEFIKMAPVDEKKMDAIPEKPKIPIAKEGDIFILGNHKLYCCDVLAGLKKLPDESVNMCVTSPPYWGLRNYSLPDTIYGASGICKHDWSSPERRILTDTSKVGGFQGKAFKKDEKMAKAYAAEGTSQVCTRCGAWKGQLGLEPTPELFVEHLVEIFSEVKRVLRSDGTFWLNIGDSYCSSGKVGHTLDRTESSILKDKPLGAAQRRVGQVEGYKPKDRIGIPHMVVFALRQAGWWWRDEIIWHKPSCMPESTRDRCTKNHEYIFMLTKSAKYYYDQELIKTESDSAVGTIRKIDKSNPMKSTMATINTVGGNKRSVWTVNTESFTEAHFAVFPSKLIEPCILAGCPKETGIVLDPFMGAFTTGIVAERYERKSIGFELSPEYCDIAIRRWEQFTGKKHKKGVRKR